jgi:hypothetical protein
MSVVLEACLDYYTRFSTPRTLSKRTCAEAIMRASDPVSVPDLHGDALGLTETLEDSLWELAGESPEDGWTWTAETRSDVEQAMALMLRSLEIMKRVHEREDPRFREWVEAHEAAEEAARSNVVPIRARGAQS